MCVCRKQNKTNINRSSTFLDKNNKQKPIQHFFSFHVSMMHIFSLSYPLLLFVCYLPAKAAAAAAVARQEGKMCVHYKCQYPSESDHSLITRVD